VLLLKFRGPVTLSAKQRGEAQLLNPDLWSTRGKRKFLTCKGPKPAAFAGKPLLLGTAGPLGGVLLTGVGTAAVRKKTLVGRHCVPAKTALWCESRTASRATTDENLHLICAHYWH